MITDDSVTLGLGPKALIMVFFTTAVIPEGGSVAWAWMTAASAFVIAIAAPVLGRMADGRGAVKRCLFYATMIGAANLLSRLYYDVLRSGNSRLAVILPAGAVALVLVMVLCCCTCYHGRSLVRGAGRLCAPRQCRTCWPKKALVAPENEAAAKAEATQPQEVAKAETEMEA